MNQKEKKKIEEEEKLKIKKVLLIAEKPSLMRDIKTAYESLPVKEKRI
jgi:hypothetical protein